MKQELTAITGTTTNQVFSKYEIQANEFAQKYNISLKCKHLKYGKHFADDTANRHIFKCMLIHKDGQSERQYTFNFGQSINSGNTPPTLYDVLTSLEKYDVGAFEDFCSEFGYDNDSIKSEKVYKAVVNEYENMLRVFGADILEEMREIQ